MFKRGFWSRRLHVGKIGMGVFALSFLCSCGGGGGSTPPPPPLPSLSLVGPATINGTLIEGTALPTQVITVKATGDLSSLSGKQLYVAISDPSALFQSNPAPVVGQGSTPDTFVTALVGRSLPAPGHLTGQVKIYVATDSGLKNPLGNSPIVIPFDVTVLPGLSVDTTTLQVATTFGDPDIQRTVQATLPPYLTDWKVENITDYSSIPDALAPTVTTQPGGLIQFTLPPEKPGTYPFRFRVSATTSVPGQSTQIFAKDISLTHTVAPNPAVDVVMTPPGPMSVTRTFADPSVTQGPSFRLIANTDITELSYQRFEALTWPAGAESHPYYCTWFDPMGHYIRIAWLEPPSTVVSLPRGTYTGQHVYSYKKAGVSMQMFLPLTLTIQ